MKIIKAISAISAQTVIYVISLAALFAGLVIVYGLGPALIVLGSIGVAISICTSFFVTWLSSKGMSNATKTK